MIVKFSILSRALRQAQVLLLLQEGNDALPRMCLCREAFALPPLSSMIALTSPVEVYLPGLVGFPLVIDYHVSLSRMKPSMFWPLSLYVTARTCTSPLPGAEG